MGYFDMDDISDDNVFDNNFEVLETSMSDIEIQIVKDYLSNNIEFMED